MVDLSVLPQQAVWIGFFHGQFMVPAQWLLPDAGEVEPAAFPAVWQALPQTAVFSVGSYVSLGASAPTSDVSVYIVQLNESPCVPRDKPPVPAGYYAGVLRSFVGRVSQGVFSQLSRAAQLVRWHRDYQFCPSCGATLPDWACTGTADQETVKLCQSCQMAHYPRISPCVLVLVTDGGLRKDSRVLLGRGVRHPPGFWSTLAGFIEAGETAEAAVAREVAEEVSVTVDQVVYRGSQSWPFPNSLMLGFWANAKTLDLVPDPHEIVEASWFPISVLQEETLPEGMFLPPVGTLSRQLIDDFVQAAQSEDG